MHPVAYVSNKYKKPSFRNCTPACFIIHVYHDMFRLIQSHHQVCCRIQNTKSKQPCKKNSNGSVESVLTIFGNCCSQRS
jgi:hypothetical protein